MSRHGSILVVDDDVATVDSLTEVLCLEGYSVVGAFDGETALAYLRDPRNVFSLVLLDLFMPGVNGFDVLDEKAKDPRLKTIPVVLMTGYAEATFQNRGGVVALVVKGTETETLLSVVKSSLTRRRLG
ncbi:MAG TPA: response regulator [Gemmatimonadaceae bacterium]|nr:response regulator [Gemmatimonadaceae bacterium]